MTPVPGGRQLAVRDLTSLEVRLVDDGLYASDCPPSTRMMAEAIRRHSPSS